MKPSDWERVDALFQRAVALPAGERAGFVRREAGSDAYLCREVLSLLDFDSERNTALGGAVSSVAARVMEESDIQGKRIGLYRILRKLGEGGMGIVYLAVRDDGEFRKEVAIKIVRQGMESPQFLERFRRERQILANLDHPHVARLLDGGAADLPGRPVAVPYLVMEYVDGLPVHRFCEQGNLRVSDRCRLFLKVCDAVAHAHSQLIVHRDLKPGNILVTTDGTPKLLDFGIAQLIVQDGSGDSTLQKRPLTIDYASPEQVRGENAGIGTDVYSLGAVLYELLTGVRPHRFRSYSAPEVERVICEETPLLPSRTEAPRARELRGDLDAIVARAMRKEPADRYQSVDAFRRDIERYLLGLPVDAQSGGMGYRAGKFVRRHRWAVAGASAAVAGLLVGAAAALWQAKVATEAQRRAEWAAEDARGAHATELEQRRRAETAAALAQSRQRLAETAQAAADAERGNAERRLGQVRELANRLLFEYQDEVAALPGSTAVRKKMVETGLAYFETLGRESGLGAAVRLEMVDGWRRLGDIQGNPYVSNLGDVRKSIASYQRALVLADGLGRPGMRARALVLLALGDAQSVAGDFASADASYEQAQAAIQSLQPREADLLSTLHEHKADLLERRGQLARSIAGYQKALALASPAASVGLYHKAGAVLLRLAKAQEAQDYLKKALTLCDQLAAGNNLDPRILRTRVWILMGLADLLRIHRLVLKSTLAESYSYLEQALQLQERLRAVEPFNQQFARDWILLEQRASSTRLAEGKFEDAIRHGHLAVGAAEEFGRLAPGQAQTSILLVISLMRLAKPLIYSNRFDDAEAAFVRAEQALAMATQQNPADGLILRERYYVARERFVLQQTRAMAPKPSAELRSAVAPLREAIRLNAELLRREPNAAMIRSDRGELHSELAMLLFDTGDAEGACAEYAETQRIRQEEKRPVRQMEALSFQELEKKLSHCGKK